MNIEKEFLSKGYVINDVEEKNSLNYIMEFIKSNLLNYSVLKNKKKNISLDETHKFLNIKYLNSLRVELISKINKDKNFRSHYYNLAKNCIDKIVGNELAMQNNLNLSIQFPNDESSLLPLHSDTWSGDSPFEVVLWLPMVDCYKTKSMFILDFYEFS